MTLRRLLIATAVAFLVSAITFAVLFPSNVDSHDTSPLYVAAWWLGIASLAVLVIGAIVALARYFAKLS